MELQQSALSHLPGQARPFHREKPRLYSAFEQSEEQRRLSGLNHKVREKLGSSYRVQTYCGREVGEISEQTYEALARCYRTVFNESWGESWTVESAKKEIKDALKWDPERIPLASFLYRGDEIVGFCWLQLFERRSLSLERDMPCELSDSEKASGMAVSEYWLDEVVNKERLMFIKELGALKEHRQTVSPFLLLPLFEKALEMQYDVAFLWTNVYSGAFKWGLGVGFSPVHFFITDNLLLMYGGVRHAVSVLSRIIDSSFSRQSQSAMVSNINRYLVKGGGRRPARNAATASGSQDLRVTQPG